MKHLPPGFRFDPSDEELVIDFLHSKVSSSSPNSLCLIPELEGFYHHYHPSQLHGEALESCGQWYFYTKKTENRVNENGYWKELMDMDQPIFARNSNKLVGWKKCLVFYRGTFPLTGTKTGWFMQEFHACSPNFGAQLHHKRRSKRPDAKKWVVCRVQQICDESHWMNTSSYEEEVELSSSDELYYLAMDDDQDDIISCLH
ncbi:unnamed protein product [Amaranthus hypochondriacus]